MLVGFHDFGIQDDAVRGQDVALCNLSNCVVRIRGVPGTVHCSNMRECRYSGLDVVIVINNVDLICRFQFGPVYRSVFVDDCSNCNFTVACQQVRAQELYVTYRYITM